MPGVAGQPTWPGSARIGRVIDDPTHFINTQQKVLFPSDAAWIDGTRR